MSLARNRPDSSRIVSSEFFDRSADGVFVVDRDWTYIFVNAAGAALVGLAASEIVGRDLWTVFPDAVGSQFERECRRAMKDREPVVLEQYFEARDQWNAIRIFPCDDGLSVYYEDVSKERRSERTARRLAVIVEASDDAVVSQTLDGVVLTWNAAAEKIYGYRADEIIGSPAVALVGPDHLDENHALLARVNAGERIEHRLTRRVGKDGGVVLVSLSMFPVCDDGGVVIGSASIARDMTESVAASDAATAQIREAEARLHFAFHDSPMPLVVIELAANGGVISEANTALERMLGYEPGDLVGRDLESFVHADDLKSVQSRITERLAGDSVRVSFESRSRHRDGHWVPVALTAIAVEDASGRWFATAAIEDITARRAAQDETVAALALVEARVGTEEALADLARLTLESADIAAFGRTACGLVARILEVDYCSILLPVEGVLGVVSEWGWDRRLLATVDNAPAPNSQAAYTVAHGSTVIVDDWLTETRFGRSPLLVAHDVHSGLSVAIRYDQSTLGAIGVQSRTPRRFDDTAVRFLESVAQLVGVALEQDRVRRRLTQSEHTLQSIVDNAPVAIHVVDPEGRFLLVNRELERIIGMPRDLLIGKSRAEIPRLAAGAPGAGLVDHVDAGCQTHPVSVEQTTSEPDGEHSYLSVSFPLVDADGRPYGLGGISTEVTELVRARAETNSAWLESMDRLARAVEFRDDDTGAHIERMAAFSALIAELLGFTPERCARIRAAAPMHDIGKLAIPDRVLLKPGPLTAEERATMDTHADVGFQLLTGSGSEVLELAAVIAQSHHERFDGTGYPRGLVGNAIAIEGRIVAIADSFDALTSDRVYRPAMTIEAAVDVMRSEAGHFDPDILDLFISRLDRAQAVWSSYHPEASQLVGTNVPGPARPSSGSIDQ